MIHPGNIIDFFKKRLQQTICFTHSNQQLHQEEECQVLMILFIETTTTIIVHEDDAAEETTTVEADIAEDDDNADPALMESSISTISPLVSTPHTCPTCDCTCPHHTQHHNTQYHSSIERMKSCATPPNRAVSPTQPAEDVAQSTHVGGALDRPLDRVVSARE